MVYRLLPLGGVRGEPWPWCPPKWLIVGADEKGVCVVERGGYDTAAPPATGWQAATGRKRRRMSLLAPSLNV
jgi:hypothetical protein